MKHERTIGKTFEWYTPPEIVHALGKFDLDPCSPAKRPYDTAQIHYTQQDNGLLQEWFGRVWLNPPYGRAMDPFMVKMALHQNGVALVFARTDTRIFQQHIFPFCDSIFFIAGRINFINTAGMKARWNGGAPSVLIAYGEENVAAISDSGIKGKHLLVNSCPVIVVGISPSWKSIVSIALGSLKNEASLNQVYDLVERIAPDKVAVNQHFKAKVRQTLQTYFTRIGKGIYSNS